MPRRYSRGSLFRLLAVVSLWAVAALAYAEYGINLPEPASTSARDIYHIHMRTMTIAAILFFTVVAIVGYALFTFRQSRGAQPDGEFHKGRFGRWSWVVVPILVLAVDMTIASSAEAVLERIWDVPHDKDMMEVKVVGHQWWWEYEYLDQKVKVESRYTPADKSAQATFITRSAGSIAGTAARTIRVTRRTRAVRSRAICSMTMTRARC